MGRPKDEREYNEKACRKCGTITPLEKLARGAKHTAGRRWLCKECVNASQRARYCPERNRKYKQKYDAQDPLRKRRSVLKTLYGLTLEDFDTLLQKQNNRCAICNTTTPGGRWQTFHIDHCHETKQIRGLLCTSCNNGLGRFKHDSALLQKAALYLKAAQ